MRTILRATVLTMFVACLLHTTPVTAKAEKTYCEGNYKGIYKTLLACEEKEEEAKNWLAVNPVQDDIYRECRNEAGQSLSRLKDCVLRESNKAYKRTLSPLNLGNSRVWYASSLRKQFPSLIRACDTSVPVDDIAVMSKDITKFNFKTSMLYKNLTPVLKIKGTVKVAAIPLPFQVKKANAKRRYELYLAAFLISPDKKVLEISSAGASKTLSSSGGTASFSIKIGSGYNFENGARVLVVASGEPITSAYPEAECVLLGAKRLTFRK